MSESSDDSDTDNARASTSTGTVKRKRYAQKYNEKWEKMAEYASWIAPSNKGDSYAYCKSCIKDINITSGKDSLKKHINTQLHATTTRTIKTQPKITKLLSGETRTFNNQVKEGEIRLGGFLAEHNLPYTLMEHLPKLIAKICPDSKIAQEIKCSRTKSQAIVDNVIGTESFKQLCSDLKENNFSLIIDESTDVSTTKHLCLVVRYVKNGRLRDSFLALIEVSTTTAVVLHETIVKFFNDHGIPYIQKMIGFAADGANVMMGANNSVAVLFQREIPHLFVMKCICHSYHLCASYACEKLPCFVEDFIRDLYNYFAHSPKRTTELKEFQTFCDLKIHKILHPSQTRWLSVHAAVKRVLEQFSALRLYFIDAVQNNDLIAAEHILNKINDQVTKLFLEFLDFVLPIFNNLNKEMQAEHPRIHVLYSEITKTLRTLFDCFIKRNYLTSTAIEDVDFKNPRNFKPIEELYLGASATSTILEGGPSAPSPEQVQFFKLRCLDFYIEACKQITARFPLKNNTLKDLIILSPENIKTAPAESIIPVCIHFPKLIDKADLQKIDSEWRELRNLNDLTSPDDTEQFWASISKIKLGDGTLKFVTLCRFVYDILSLPHSSATVERIFSAVNLLKTKQRNRLTTSSIAGLLHTKRYIDKANCFDFVVDQKLISAMSQQRWYEKPDKK